MSRCLLGDKIWIDRAVVFVVAVALVGCTALQPVPMDPGVPRVAIGDLVRVGYRDGSYQELKVRALRADGFVGDGSRGAERGPPIEVRYAEIVSLDSHEYSRRRTLTLVLGTVALVALLGVMVSAGAPPPP